MMNKVESWFYSLFGGMIGGGATAASTWLGMAGAKTLGIDVPSLNLKALGVIFVSGAMTNLFFYLKQSPLPPLGETQITISPSPNSTTNTTTTVTTEPTTKQ